MRKLRSETIIQISSLGGRMGTPGSAAYHPAKWAVSGFTESISQETVPFGWCQGDGLGAGRNLRSGCATIALG
jgi:NAD(P)-dependent dehydrogenase (short-subunit alcohol dehydrogenase family)